MNLSLTEAFLRSVDYPIDTFADRLSFAEVKGDRKAGRGIGTRTETGIYGSRYYAEDVLGKEYYLPVKVTVGNNIIPGSSSTYAEALGIDDKKGDYTGVWDLPYPMISAAEQTKKIVDTELTERGGMVSELINLSGYKISIRGYLINQKANEFPQDEYDTMVRLGNLNIPVRIDNVMTDILFMDSQNPGRMATIRNMKFTPRPGVKNVVEYMFDLITEVPFNLIDIS